MHDVRSSPSGHGDEQHVSTATPGEGGGQAEEDAASAMEQGARARPHRHRQSNVRVCGPEWAV